jgi:hypothetical protein
MSILTTNTRNRLEQSNDAAISGSSNAELNSNKVQIRQDSNVPNDIGGSFEIKKIALLMNSGDEIDIKGYFSNLIVEESIFASSISGQLTIDDTAGGLEKFVIHGGETLILKMCKPNSDDIIIWREDLVVHKISKSPVSPLNLMSKFDIFFTSKSNVNSLKKNLFKSYKNTTIWEAVNSIYKEMSVNDIIAEDPKITLTSPFISTGVPPHKAIDYLAQRACSKDKYFVFFERFVPVFGNYADGKPFTTTHYFGSVEKLLKDSENVPPKTIVFAPKINAMFEGGATIRASRYERLENFNHMNGMLLGFYNSTVSSINPIKRSYKVQKLSYTDETDETKDFYSNKLFNSLNIFNTYDDKKNETPGRKLILSSINESVNRDSWLSNHIYGQLSKSMFKISVDIQGGTNTIGIGNVVNFATPSQISVMLNPQSAFPELDPIYSGRYLVTTVIHAMSSSQYVKTMHLSRGSSPLNFDKHTEYDATFEDIKADIRTSLGNRRAP